jgi:hypothetical protein
MKLKKSVTLKDEDIIKLFENDKVVSITYFDKSEELKHLEEVFSKTKDLFYRSTVKFNYNEIKNNPKCLIHIIDFNTIRKLKGSKDVMIELKLIKNIDISKIKQNIIIEKLSYDLYTIPDLLTS